MTCEREVEKKKSNTAYCGNIASWYGCYTCHFCI